MRKKLINKYSNCCYSFLCILYHVYIYIYICVYISLFIHTHMYVYYISIFLAFRLLCPRPSSPSAACLLHSGPGGGGPDPSPELMKQLQAVARSKGSKKRQTARHTLSEHRSLATPIGPIAILTTTERHSYSGCSLASALVSGYVGHRRFFLRACDCTGAESRDESHHIFARSTFHTCRYQRTYYLPFLLWEDSS